MATDYTTPAGQVRLLITAGESNDLDAEIFTEPQIEAFLALEKANVFRAAALALETIAVDQVLVLKVIRTLDVQTDGAAVAKALMARAVMLRERSDDEPDTADDDFAVAEFADPVFGYRQRIDRQILRERI